MVEETIEREIILYPKHACDVANNVDAGFRFQKQTFYDLDSFLNRDICVEIYTLWEYSIFNTVRKLLSVV